MPASSMVYYLYNMGRFIYFFDLIVYVLAAQTSASQAGPKFKIVRQEVWKNNSRDFSIKCRKFFFRSDFVILLAVQTSSHTFTCCQT